MGSFYVVLAHRLKGVGKELGRLAMEYIKGKNAAMNGVLALTDMYRANGFPHCREFNNAFTVIETKDIHVNPDHDDGKFLIKVRSLT